MEETKIPTDAFFLPEQVHREAQYTLCRGNAGAQVPILKKWQGFRGLVTS